MNSMMVTAPLGCIYNVFCQWTIHLLYLSYPVQLYIWLCLLRSCRSKNLLSHTQGPSSAGPHQSYHCLIFQQGRAVCHLDIKFASTRQALYKYLHSPQYHSPNCHYLQAGIWTVSQSFLPVSNLHIDCYLMEMAGALASSTVFWLPSIFCPFFRLFQMWAPASDSYSEV